MMLSRSQTFIAITSLYHPENFILNTDTHPWRHEFYIPQMQTTKFPACHSILCSRNEWPRFRLRLDDIL